MRDIDVQFEHMMKHYNDDDDAEEEDEEEEDETGDNPSGKPLQEAYDEVIATSKGENQKKTYKLGVDEQEKEGTTTKKDLIQNKKNALKTLKTLTKTLAGEADDTESVHKAIDSMFQVVVREKWDVESIISTYSNTENHPGLISEPKRTKKIIKISEKTGIPLGVLEKPKNKKNKKEDEEEDAEDDDEEDQEGSNLGAPREKEETKAEKKARKAATKALRKQNLQRKKQLKKVFAVEKNITKAQMLTQKQQNPATIRF